MLFAFDLMVRAGIAGSLMSLGAIDFGLIVDSSVISVENTVRRLAEDRTDRSPHSLAQAEHHRVGRRTQRVKRYALGDGGGAEALRAHE